MKALAEIAATPAPVEIWLYVLELEGGHFYVGQSSNLDMRIKSHKARKASEWTKRHPYVREMIRRPTGTNDLKTAEAFENTWTLEMMLMYGWESVRGGWWCNKCPILTRKGLIAHGKWEVLGLPAPAAVPVPAETIEAESPQVAIEAPPPVIIIRKKRRLLPGSGKPA